MTEDKVADGQASDIELMLRVRCSDDRAFAELYHRYYTKLLNFFYGMSRTAQTADDLCQETFLRVWKLRQRYAATGSFPGYLFSFARNIWLERCREMTRRRKLGVRQEVDELWHGVPAPARDYPDEAAARSELRERILDAVDRLPHEQRMVFVLRTIEGLSTEEIARVMECPVNTVRSRKLLAITKLRRALQGLLVL